MAWGKIMKIIALFLALLFSALLLQCQGILESTESELKFSAFDKNGVLLREGTIVLDTTDPDDVTGIWRIRDVLISDEYKKGTLRGFFADGILVVDLNPGWVDNNFFMRGTYDGKFYKGTWQQVGFPGVMESGSFIAAH